MKKNPGVISGKRLGERSSLAWWPDPVLQAETGLANNPDALPCHIVESAGTNLILLCFFLIHLVPLSPLTLLSSNRCRVYERIPQTGATFPERTPLPVLILHRPIPRRLSPVIFNNAPVRKTECNNPRLQLPALVKQGVGGGRSVSREIPVSGPPAPSGARKDFNVRVKGHSNFVTLALTFPSGSFRTTAETDY